MMAPLVHGPDIKGGRSRRIGSYAAGVLTSSLLLGAFLGMFGNTIVPDGWSRPGLAFLAALCTVLVLADSDVCRLRTPMVPRQTVPVWWRRYGESRALFLWGLDIGLGFSTLRVGSLYWMVVAASVLSRSTLTACMILGAYGLGLVINMCLGAFLFQRAERGLHANLRALSLAGWAKPVTVTTGMVFATVLGAASLHLGTL